MKIVHILATPCAGAPSTLSKYLNKLPGVTSEVLTTETTDLNECRRKLHTDQNIQYRLNRADVLHWHNMYIENDLHAKQLVTFHSPPENRMVHDSINMLTNNNKVKKTVVSHYHTLLDAYSGYTGVRNIVDVDDSYVTPCNPKQHVLFGMTPTPEQPGTIWQTKGFDKTLLMMKRLKMRNSRVHFRTLTDATRSDCLEFKSNCDLVIDECVTPGFHLSGLEGLALGKPTVCWIDDRVCDMLKRLTGAEDVPFISDSVYWLEDTLYRLLERGDDHLREVGSKSREWFCKYWKTSDILNQYVQLYNE